MAIEAHRDGFPPAFVSPDSGQPPQAEFMNPEKFVQALNDHVVRIQMDSGIPGGGTILRLQDDVKDIPFDWENPETWKPSQKVLERYVIIMDPRRTQIDFSAEFIFQIYQMRRDISRHRHHEPAVSELEEKEQRNNAREQALAFYFANTELVNEKLAAAFPQLTGKPQN